MNQNVDKGMKEFGEEIADDLGYTRNYKNTRLLKASLNFKPQRKILVFGGVGILILIILISIFSGGGNELSKEDLDSFQVRLNQLEERLTRLEGVEDRGVFLEMSLTKRMDELTQNVDILQKRMASAAAKIQAPPAMQREPISLSKRRYHKVRPGDSLYRIAQQYGISVDELCRLNNITPSKVIHPGQKLLVTPGSRQ